MQAHDTSLSKGHKLLLRVTYHKLLVRVTYHKVSDLSQGHKLLLRVVACDAGACYVTRQHHHLTHL